MEKIHKEVLEIKGKLASAGIDDSHIVYMPQVPVLGWEHQFVIEEHFGIKVARLVSAPND